MRKRSPALRFLAYAGRHRWKFAAGGLLLLATNGFQTAIPWFIKDGIEAVRSGAPTAVLLRSVELLLAAAVLQALTRVFSRTVIYQAGRDIEAELRGDLFAHLTKLSPSFYDRWRTGDILSRATNDTSDIRMFLGVGFLQLCNTFFTYVVTVGAMLVLNPSLTLYALIPYPILVVVFNRLSKGMHDRSLAMQTELGALSAQLQESLSGILLMKAYGREQAEARAFERANARYRDAALSLERLEGFTFPLVGALAGLATATLLGLGGREVSLGHVTLGEFVAFNGYLGMLLWPTIGLGWILNVLQRGLAAMGRLEELFHHVPSVSDAPDCLEVRELEGDIELRGLSFAYPAPQGGQPRQVLQDITARIPRGSTCAIVGSTGAGKTTLIHLLARLYEVGDGQVFIDGHDVTRIPLEVLRRSIAFVPQDNHLFSISIGENLAYGLPEMDWDKVRKASSMARLDDDLGAFPQGLDTLVGERGVTLSGGQRQRVCIGRALIREAPIAIIDDALSSVDTATEEQILTGLRRSVKGRTAILIAHRISTIKWVDLILVLDQGRLVEQGSHRQLVARGGFYARMASRQALTESLERELIGAPASVSAAAS